MLHNIVSTSTADASESSDASVEDALLRLFFKSGTIVAYKEIQNRTRKFFPLLKSEPPSSFFELNQKHVVHAERSEASEPKRLGRDSNPGRESSPRF